MSKKEEMQKMVDCFESSGQTRTNFCRTEGINLYTFIYWQKKLKQMGKPSSFVILEKPIKEAPVGGLELEFPNGVKLRNVNSLELVRQIISWERCSA